MLRSWYSLKNHIFDLKEKLLEIKKKASKKKIFLLGESMGGAIVISLLNSYDNLPIDGSILRSSSNMEF